MTWHHQLDSEVDPGGDDPAGAAPDSNPLEGDSELMVEQGSIEWEGESVEFTEEWQRLAPASAVAAAEAGDRRVEVTVGRWRIEVDDARPAGSFRATRYERDDSGTWLAVGHVHRPGAAGEPADRAVQ